MTHLPMLICLIQTVWDLVYKSLQDTHSATDRKIMYSNLTTAI